MTPEEQQLPKSKIFSAEAYLTTLLTLSLLLKIVPATKTHHRILLNQQVSVPKPPLHLLLCFAPG